MWKDPIVEETRELREEYAAKLNHDIDAIFEDVQKRQAQAPRKPMSSSQLTQILPPGIESIILGILAVAEDLPEWFDETARTKSIPIDIRHQEGFVAVSAQRVIGFVTLYIADGRLHIGWLGVVRKFHKQGIGARLLAAAEKKARDLGIDELATYTLGDSVDYEPYDLTRNFYWKRGFSIYKRAKTDNPGCEEEIWISKRVRQEENRRILIMLHTTGNCVFCRSDLQVATSKPLLLIKKRILPNAKYKCALSLLRAPPHTPQHTENRYGNRFDPLTRQQAVIWRR